jgi:hypothetical protein
MKKEYWLATVIGLIIMAYVLDSVVNPLTLGLPTPYHFLTPEKFKVYPFTFASIIIKSIALFIAPILILSAMGMKRILQGLILLVISGLLQLYALQDIASGAHTVPLEWSISFALTGMLLLLTSIIFIIAGFLGRVSNVGTGSSDDFEL